MCLQLASLQGRCKYKSTIFIGFSYINYFQRKNKNKIVLCCYDIVLSYVFNLTDMENLNDLGESLNTEIVCTLAGLGCSEGNDYYKSPDCLGKLFSF